MVIPAVEEIYGKKRIAGFISKLPHCVMKRVRFDTIDLKRNVEYNIVEYLIVSLN